MASHQDPPAQPRRSVTVVVAVVRAGRPDDQTALGHALERPNGGLTVREHEVLELAADGLSTSEIAERMFLSRATIKTHLAHLYDKLGVSDKTAAVATALRRRLID